MRRSVCRWWMLWCVHPGTETRRSRCDSSEYEYSAFRSKESKERELLDQTTGAEQICAKLKARCVPNHDS